LVVLAAEKTRERKSDRMTIRSEELTTEDKIVVFFDVCSSTTILEDLLSSGHLKMWRNVLIATKGFLRKCSSEYEMEIHKFIGDGWVLLFPPTTSGEALVKVLTELACFFHRQLEERIIPLLQSPPDVLGLTFGVDSGKIIRILMLERSEYIGRPLNVASRLQSAIKDNDKRPAYKVLFSKHCFHTLGLGDGTLPAEPVKRKLRNLLGGDNYHCMKLRLRIPATCK
jgi:class 3 adenylate cyclase